MRHRSMFRVSGLAALLAFLMALTLEARPASAAGTRPAGAAGSTSLGAATAAHLAALKPARRAFQQASPGSSESRSFFRTPTGVAAVVLMVAGGGFTIYKVSKDQDPVKSPIR